MQETLATSDYPQVVRYCRLFFMMVCLAAVAAGAGSCYQTREVQASDNMRRSRSVADYCTLDSSLSPFVFRVEGEIDAIDRVKRTGETERVVFATKEWVLNRRGGFYNIYVPTIIEEIALESLFSPIAGMADLRVAFGPRLDTGEVHSLTYPKSVRNGSIAEMVAWTCDQTETTWHVGPGVLFIDSIEGASSDKQDKLVYVFISAGTDGESKRDAQQVTIHELAAMTKSFFGGRQGVGPVLPTSSNELAVSAWPLRHIELQAYLRGKAVEWDRGRE